jgi:hypothetical protein
MGLERQATMPLEEARALMRLLYDDFACHCAPEFLENSLQVVLDRLAARSTHKQFVELLPLPTGPRDLHRLKPLFRYDVFRRHYGSAPETRHYLEGPIRERLAANPRLLDQELAKIAEELERRPGYVYANRDRGFDWEGASIPSEQSRGEPPQGREIL